MHDRQKNEGRHYMSGLNRAGLVPLLHGFIQSCLFRCSKMNKIRGIVI
ncbi:hypothetical protein C5S53_15265 [Methanophagales archaeon]|nr:hypothetical protein C5S53_15265 [Methanophagales archaeon]